MSMKTEDKMRIIRGWVNVFYASQNRHNEWYGELFLYNKHVTILSSNVPVSSHTSLNTIGCPTYDEAVEESYKLINEYVWDIIHK